MTSVTEASARSRPPVTNTRQGTARLRGSANLKLVEATSFENDVVLLRYEIKK